MFRSIRSLIVATVCVLALGMVVVAPSPVFAVPTAETVDNPVPVAGEDAVRSLARPPFLDLGVRAFASPSTRSAVSGTAAGPDGAVTVRVPLPQEEDECWGCARAKCHMGGEYRTCAATEVGSSNCRQGGYRKGRPCGRCIDRGELCEETFASIDETDAALDAFASGEMLPSDGRYYIGVAGNELVLRQKCGGAAVARLATANVGHRSRVILAGG